MRTHKDFLKELENADPTDKEILEHESEQWKDAKRRLSDRIEDAFDNPRQTPKNSNDHYWSWNGTVNVSHKNKGEHRDRIIGKIVDEYFDSHSIFIPNRIYVEWTHPDASERPIDDLTVSINEPGTKNA